MGPARSPPRHPRPSQDLWSTEQLADGEGSFALALLCFAHQNTIPITITYALAQRSTPGSNASSSYITIFDWNPYSSRHCTDISTSLGAASDPAFEAHSCRSSGVSNLLTRPTPAR